MLPRLYVDSRCTGTSIDGATDVTTSSCRYGIKGATAGDADEKAFERVCYADGTWASIADKSKFDKPAECEKCKAAGYKKIEVSDFYRNTQGARWGGKDFRSGNPGEKTYWTVGPISVSEMSELNFEFEYVTGYSWNCGWSRYTGELPCLDSERFQKNGQCAVCLVSLSSFFSFTVVEFLMLYVVHKVTTLLPLCI